MPGDDIQTYHKGPPANNQDYGDFVAAVAAATRARSSTSRYGTSLTSSANGAVTPSTPKQYTALLKVAHDSIKAVRPRCGDNHGGPRPHR